MTFTAGGEKRFFPMQNGRIDIFRIIGVPGLAFHEINRDRLAQGRMGVIEKVRVRKEGKLQFIRSELDQIETNRAASVANACCEADIADALDRLCPGGGRSAGSGAAGSGNQGHSAR
jgi:hypothetical protein